MVAARTYLDFNATTPLRPAARDRMVAVLQETGNPSSIHAEGRRARAAIEEARHAVVGMFGAAPDGVVFTSGATEAAALALHPGLCASGDSAPAARLLVLATEHAAVLQGHRFPSEHVEILPVGNDGLIDLSALERALAEPAGRPIVAVQAANSETGVVQPLAAVAARVHAHGGLLVSDCAQAAGRIDCRFETIGADVVITSAHKLGGPQGIGALVLRSDAIRLGTSLVRGGGQERGQRGGTENVTAVAGFGVAAQQAASLADAPHMAALRDHFEAVLRARLPEAVIFGVDAPRLPNTSAFALPGLANETLLIGLDLAGVAVSTGSACSSGKVSRSHVLEAMRVDDHLIGGLVRISLGWSSTREDVVRALDEIGRIVERVKTRSIRSAA